MAVALWAAGCGSAVDEVGEAEASTSSSTTDVPGSTSGPATTADPVGSTSVDPTTGGATTSSDSTGVVFPEFCSVFEQDCPEGYKCSPYARDGGTTWNDTICVPVVDDPAGYGEPCMAEESALSGYDNCGLGALCLVEDADTLEGECIELCGGSPEEPMCEQPEARCVISAEGGVAPCVLPCDPLGDTCDSDEVCVSANDFFRCMPDASGAGGGVGEDCDFTNGCDPGLGCFLVVEEVCDGGASGCCLPYCSLAAPDCPDMLTCLPFFEPENVPEGYEDVGVCHVPG